MKFCIYFASLLTLGLTVQFKVEEKNETCILLNVSGSFDYKAEVNGTEKSVSLDLNKAMQLETSNCSSLKLNFTENSAQVWFDFSDNSEDKQVISLVSTFMPSELFKISYNGSADFHANSVFQSPKNGSYKCISQVSTQLGGESPKDVNITVAAVLQDFQVQSSDIKGDTFSEATECSQDQTTSSPTTTPATTPTTTQLPPPDNTYYFSSDNVTCINMTGIIAFMINYETKNKGQRTEVVYIPSDHTINGSCKYENSSSMQSIEIKFFNETWSTLMVFGKQDDESYYISQIKMTYVFDVHLPDALLSGKTGNAFVNTTDDYRKANLNGYYLCNSNLTLALDSNVSLSTKEFKYQAFNNKTTAPLDSDKNVSECSQDEDSNSIVPIAVGAALAGLVVIVLIAYLIGRRRSKKSGYESV